MYEMCVITGLICMCNINFQCIHILNVLQILLFLSFLVIEDLTRKTGNYKQFPIFVNMMESAILKVCSGMNIF